MDLKDLEELKKKLEKYICFNISIGYYSYSNDIIRVIRVLKNQIDEVKESTKNE